MSNASYISEKVREGHEKAMKKIRRSILEEVESFLLDGCSQLKEDLAVEEEGDGFCSNVGELQIALEERERVWQEFYDRFMKKE